MLAWVMNLGFAASSTGSPPSTGSGSGNLTIGILIGIRCLVLAFLVSL